jgi:hypothetical protein
MKRSSFYRITLSFTAAGALVGIALLALWEAAGIQLSDNVWVLFFPASMMLMMTQIAGPVGTAVIVALSIMTNAALWFIGASVVCLLGAALRGGVRP